MRQDEQDLGYVSSLWTLNSLVSPLKGEMAGWGGDMFALLHGDSQPAWALVCGGVGQ